MLTKTQSESCLASEIRNILNIPQNLRAMPERTKKASKKRPEIPASLIDRQEQLKSVGIASKIRWDALGQDYYIVYTPENLETVPEWN